MLRLALSLAILCLLTTCSHADDRPPNIILILLDDLGKEWVSCYGATDIETPNVDRIAREGMRFQNAYSMPQCTPSRACLLTGQYPWRNGWINHWDVPRWGKGCHFDPNHNLSFARLLRRQGYRTCAAGKWQINDFRVAPEVMREHGFNQYCMWTGYEKGNPASGQRYWDPYLHTSDGSRIYESEFGDQVFTQFVVDFMEANRHHPMLIYYPMCLPHGPLTTTPAERHVTTAREKHRAMVRYTDQLLGRLLNALHDLRLAEDTILIWTTDNGSARGISGRRNGRTVRGAKGQSNEAGVCQPFIVYGPGQVPAGVVTDALVDFSDLFPTFIDLAHASLPDNTVIDGKSFAPLILGHADDSPREWIMAMGGQPARFDQTRQRVAPQFEFRDRVIRDKRFKLRIDQQQQPIELYDLQQDPTESTNLINSVDANVLAARKNLEAIVDTFPEKDGWPRYDPIYLNETNASGRVPD
ncbi:MAG: sulfatase-like hydrolase/transferase [Pirellulaceae bacterium]|nr:sulfatase-like hydrolase/transferase [Pirellulaceae bacterium]